MLGFAPPASSVERIIAAGCGRRAVYSRIDAGVVATRAECGMMPTTNHAARTRRPRHDATATRPPDARGPATADALRVGPSPATGVCCVHHSMASRPALTGCATIRTPSNPSAR